MCSGLLFLGRMTHVRVASADPSLESFGFAPNECCERKPWTAVCVERGETCT